jgi:exonuclease III
MSWDKVVSWNTKVNRDPGTVGNNLQDLIDDTKPDIICLQEAGGYVSMLKNRFGEKWWVYAKSGWEESQMNPVLVWKKDRAKQTYEDGWNTLRYQTKWTGPQGGVHYGRTWTWVLVDDAVVMSFHRCTNGSGSNSNAFIDEHDKVVNWAGHRNRPWLVLGDHNCGPAKTFAGSSKKIAMHTESWIRSDPADPGIDYAITHGMEGTVKHGKAYGSDHEAIIFNRG